MPRQNSTLSIIGLVVGVISILLSFIPCIGSIGGLFGIVGLVLGFLGRSESIRKDISTTPAIIAIVLSALALLIGGAQFFFLSKAGSNFTSVEYASCDELLTDWDATVKKMEDIKSTPEEEASLSMMGDLINITTKVAAIKIKSDEMACNDDPDFKAKFDAISNRVEGLE